MEFLILPHQLYSKKFLSKKYKYVLWEHPQYFTKYAFNNKKLILHRGSMKHYYDYLKEKGFKVKYIPFNKKFVPSRKDKTYILFDPIDKIIKQLPGKPIIVESPNFLLNKELYAKYRKKTKNFFFNAFYMWSKKQIDLMPAIKSKDKENRKKLPKDIDIPELPSNKRDLAYIKEASKYVEKHFGNNYGNSVVEEFVYPISRKTAKVWLRDFINKKMKNFGKYQDAIKSDDSYLFHSVLSSSLNIGLLNPWDVVKEVMKNKKKIPLNSLEGFIRQLFWREYQRYCYIYIDFKGHNYFGNRKKLNKKWYNGTVVSEGGEVSPVNDCIKKAFKNGYLNHIERLMVMANYMNLSGIHPEEMFKWFMEFPIDSYEWVMRQNVDMGSFMTGGLTMRRPYLSSSNYILKMSDYKKGKWSEKWDKLYKAFLKKHKKKLWKYRYYFRGLK